jgi:formylglycine-generating enzyme required for sulfatase activity
MSVDVRSGHCLRVASLLLLLLLVLAAGCKGADKPDAPHVSATAAASSSPAAPAKPVCPEGMVHLPGGKLAQGSDRTPQEGELDERPVRDVEVSGFCLDKTEVTAGAYAACVDAGACTKPIDKDPPYAWTEQFTWGKAERKTHPINGVSFAQAQAYCKHADKRLPTEAEWEFAARGVPSRVHPWGDAAPGAKLLNSCDTLCRAEGKKHSLAWVAMFEEPDGFAYTAPVGSYPAGASPEGILDLEGNVSEWTEGIPCPHDKPACGKQGNVVHGSSWLDQFKGEVRVTARYRRGPGAGYASVGFRCAT